MPPLLILTALGAAGLLAAAAFEPQLSARGRLVKRARALAAGATDPKTKAERALRQSAQGSFDDLVRRLLPRPAALQVRLEATGRRITLTHYGAASLAVMVASAVMCMSLHAPLLMAILEAAGTGIWLPHAVIGFLMAQRRSRFLKLFPEAIGLIVRGLRAGLPVGETISVVGREIADPVGEEFRRVAHQVRLGLSLEAALWQAAKRIGLPEFNFLVIGLSVQRETGGNLAETLENLEQILRRRQQMRLKIKAMASEATASGLILGCLPVLMMALMYMFSAEYIGHLFTSPIGRVMLGAATFSLVVGGFVMRKMTKFEIILPTSLFGSHGGLVLGLVVGLANFLTILSVMRALSPKDLLAARARDHAKRRSELRTARLRIRRGNRRQSIGIARTMLGKLKLDRTEESKTVADQLAQAGWRSRDAVTVFLTLRLASPFAIGAFAYLFAPAIFHRHDQMFRLIVTAAGILGGAYLPTLLLKNSITRRRQKIQKALPDALDLFVICAEAGLSLDAAVTRVGREIGGASAEMADELGLTAIELGFLPDRRDALHNLVRRTGTPDVRGLVNTLVQTEKYGTPLAHSLRVLASEFRDTRMMKAEEKAARLPATLTVPMIMFILPPLFVILIGPAIIQVLAASWH